MFRCGYCNIVVQNDVPAIGDLIRALGQCCEKIVLGIPDELTFARLFGDIPYSENEIRQELLNRTDVSEVIIIRDWDDYFQIYEKVHFDAMWYGSRFGRRFDEFAEFAKEKGIAMLSMLPDHYVEIGFVDALKIALENLQYHQKIVLFGSGAYFDIYMERYGKRFVPAYAVDSSPEKQGTKKNGVEIQALESLQQEKKEDVLIILCAKNYDQMLQEINQLGDFDYRPMLYNNPISLLEEYALTRRGELEYLKETHAILADMLKEFDRVCRKHQLHYYMICGSLIGVVRHQGFIPWDDDVDVAKPREDYKRFRQIAVEEWKDGSYRCLGYEKLGNGAFLDCMPRVVDMRYRLPMKVYDKVRGRADKEFINRPFIDIYVMDNAFDNDRKHMFYMNMMKGIYNLMMGHRGNVDYDEYRIQIPEKTIRLMKLLHFVGKCLPLTFLTWWYDHLSMKANKRDCENYFMNSCAIRCIERKFKKEFFGEGKRMPFLDFEVSVPADCDGLMEAMGYHGYMQFPRMSIRKPSHYFNSDIVVW